MANTITLTFLRPSLSPSTHPRRTNHRVNHHTSHLHLKFLPNTTPKKPISLKPLSISNSTTIIPNSPNPNPNPNPNPINFPQIPPTLFNSTKTLTALLTLAISISYKLTQLIQTLIPSPSTIQYLHNDVFPTVGPMLFATINDPPSVSGVKTPFSVVAAGMSKCLQIYNGVLIVRVLLSWFPNVPWDIQPLSSIRDLCDPFLSVFRNIIPPLFNTIDVSPLLAFAVLTTIAGVVKCI